MSDSTIAPPKTIAIFFKYVSTTSRHKERVVSERNLHTLSCLQKTIRRDGKGQRISGDTAGSWFQNRRLRYRNVGGGYRSKTVCARRTSAPCAYFASNATDSMKWLGAFYFGSPGAIARVAIPCSFARLKILGLAISRNTWPSNCLLHRLH